MLHQWDSKHALRTSRENALDSLGVFEDSVSSIVVFLWVKSFLWQDSPVIWSRQFYFHSESPIYETFFCWSAAKDYTKPEVRWKISAVWTKVHFPHAQGVEIIMGGWKLPPARAGQESSIHVHLLCSRGSSWHGWNHRGGDGKFTIQQTFI